MGAWILFAHGNGGCVAFFHVFADESGKLSGKTDYTALCGFVGHSLEWQRVSFEWDKSRLRLGVPPIHMAQIMSQNPKPEWAKMQAEWGTRWTTLRDAMLQEFASIIASSGVVAVGTVVDANAYRNIQSDAAVRLPVDDSNVFVFQELIMGAIERIESIDQNSLLSLIVDDDQESAWSYYQMLSLLKVNPNPMFDKVRRRVHGICFGNDSSYPGLQAADMIAYESRRLMVDRIKTPNIPPSQLYRLLTHNGINQTKLYDGDQLRKVATESAKIIGALQPDHTK
jgi:hypothetical protein